MTYLAGVADDTEVPMIILVDGDDNKVLLKDINFSGPSFDSIMPKIQIKWGNPKPMYMHYLPSNHWIFSSLDGAWL